MTTLIQGWAAALWLVLAGGLFASTQLDLEFDPGAGASGPIQAIAVQSDGRLLVAGMFDEFNGQPHHLITRLNPDGSVDPTWDLAPVNLPTTRDPVVVDVLVDGDDNVLLMWQDDWWLRGWRFGKDGVRDNSPGSPLPYSSFEIPRTFSWGVPSLALTSSGDVLVGRNWSEIVGIKAKNYVAMDRYRPDGTKDPSFSLQWPEMNGWYGGGSDDIYSLAVTDEGDILVGRSSDMLRFHPDGSLDRQGSWSRPGDFYSVDQLIPLPEDRVLVRGRSSIRVVERDGSPAAGFTPPEFHSWVDSANLFEDGRILVAGGFTRVNGIARNKLAVLLSDGTVDPTFDPGTGPAMRPDGSLQVAPQPGGGVFVAGDFDAFDGSLRAGVARLKPALPIEGTELGLGATLLHAAEPDGRLELVVLRRGDLETESSVDYRTAPQTAVPGADYLPVGGTLTFAAGESAKAFTIPILDDWVEEPEETFEVFLSDPIGATLVQEQDRAVIVIVSEDKAVSFTAGKAAVYESDRWYSTMVNGLSGVDIVLDDITAIKGQDYLPAGIGAYRISIPIPNNPVADGDRSFRINLVNFRRPYVPGAITSQVVTIRDDDTVIRPARGVNGPILAVAPDANGGWWAGGEFTLYDGFERPYLARLQPDLTLDENWSMAQPPDGTVNDIWPGDDGSMYLAGYFRTFGDAPCPGLAKVLPTGDLDPAFQPYTMALEGSLETRFVEVLQISDGSLVAVNRADELVHLNADGTLIGILEDALHNSSPIGRSLTPLGSGGFALNTYSLLVYGPDGLRDHRFTDTDVKGDVPFLVLSDQSMWYAAYNSLRHRSSTGELVHEFSRVPLEGLDRWFSVRALVRLPDDRFLACLDLSDPERPENYFARWIRFLPDGQIDPAFQSWSHSGLRPAFFPLATEAPPNASTVVTTTDTGAGLMRIDPEGYPVNDLRFEAIARLPNDEVHLTWKGQPGTNSYTLEFSDDLSEWAELPPPDGWRTEWMNRIDREAAGKSARFYRLRFW